MKVHGAKAGLNLERERREKEGDLGTGGSPAAEKSFAWGGAAAAARSVMIGSQQKGKFAVTVAR